MTAILTKDKDTSGSPQQKAAEIEAVGLEKTYPPETEALDGLGFEVPKGPFLDCWAPTPASRRP